MPLQVTKSKIGNATITQIVECEIGPLFKDLLPDATPENVKKIEWLKLPYRNEDYTLNASSQCFIVEINNRVLVVDTCIGNEKTIEEIPIWNNMQLDFLETLNNIGFDRNKVTDVLCTHLHVDHVGWNTYKKEGKWMPTFPNAKYHFAKSEYEYWTDKNSTDPLKDLAKTSFNESVNPIVDAGLANFIDVNQDLGDGISVFSTPGHTHAHISVLFEVGDNEKFIIGGDMAHHPCQIAKPHWALAMDYDKQLSAKTRIKIFEQLQGTDTLYGGSHFRIPSFGKITKDSNGEFVFNSIDKSI